ncbi:hypothetical protein GCM10009108_21830 [Castellaniella ginsengisoli]|uniref:Uncharacterized protein n=1 Tax=Castellaniella ginsengisoli TaxID=546114 RepID=A0ABN1L133_9BURK
MVYAFLDQTTHDDVGAIEFHDDSFLDPCRAPSGLLAARASSGDPPHDPTLGDSRNRFARTHRGASLHPLALDTRALRRNVVEMDAPDRACDTSWSIKTQDEKNRVCDPGVLATSGSRHGADRTANLPRCNISRKRAGWATGETPVGKRGFAYTGAIAPYRTPAA